MSALGGRGCRRRRRLVAAGATVLIAVAVLVAAACVPSYVSGAAVTLSDYERQLVEQINLQRTDAGLVALKVNAKLVDAARAHSAEMGEYQYMGHDSHDGEGFADRLIRFGYKKDGYRCWRAGEALAWGTGLYSSPVYIVGAWMDCKVHRDVIMKKSFRDIGVGVVSCDHYGDVEGPIWFFTFDAGRRIKK